MMNIIRFMREQWALSLFPLSIAIGWYLDRWYDEKLAIYRNKSKLFQRELKPGEEVTWK